MSAVHRRNKGNIAHQREAIGAALRRARLGAGATLNVWRSLAGCSLNHLSLVERGERTLSAGKLARLPLTDEQRAEIAALEAKTCR